MQDFTDALAWFGPLPKRFFENITYLYKSPWYHHRLTDRITLTLFAAKEGWLMRLGKNPGEFELISYTREIILIKTSANGKINFGTKTYETWNELMTLEKDNLHIDFNNAIKCIKD